MVELKTHHNKTAQYQRRWNINKSISIMPTHLLLGRQSVRHPQWIVVLCWLHLYRHAWIDIAFWLALCTKEDKSDEQTAGKCQLPGETWTKDERVQIFKYSLVGWGLEWKRAQIVVSGLNRRPLQTMQLPYDSSEYSKKKLNLSNRVFQSGLGYAAHIHLVCRNRPVIGCKLEFKKLSTTHCSSYGSTECL